MSFGIFLTTCRPFPCGMEWEQSSTFPRVWSLHERGWRCSWWASMRKYLGMPSGFPNNSFPASTEHRKILSLTVFWQPCKTWRAKVAYNTGAEAETTSHEACSTWSTHAGRNVEICEPYSAFGNSVEIWGQSLPTTLCYDKAAVARKEFIFLHNVAKHNYLGRRPIGAEITPAPATISSIFCVKLCAQKQKRSAQTHIPSR